MPTRHDFAYLQTAIGQFERRQQTPSSECEHRMHALQNV
jgi:hypothetical protein